MEIVKLQTQIDKLNAFIGIVKNDDKKLPLKLYNIKNKLTFNKVKSFFEDVLNTNINFNIVTRKRHVIIVKYAFLNSLFKVCKLTILEIHEIFEFDFQIKYDRSNIYYAIEKHDLYMIRRDPDSLYYKKLWNEITTKLETYLLN